jgi:hypothetical protein
MSFPEPHVKLKNNFSFFVATLSVRNVELNDIPELRGRYRGFAEFYGHSLGFLDHEH